MRLSDSAVSVLLLRSVGWLVVVAALVLIGGCSAADDEGTDAVDRDRTEGTWIVEGVAPEASVVFDTAAASVEVRVGCRLLLGSFTFVDSGRAGQDDATSEGTAGFSLPGRSTDDCPVEDDEAAAQLTDRLQQVDRWVQEDDRLAFEGPQGQVVLLPAG